MSMHRTIPIGVCLVLVVACSAATTIIGGPIPHATLIDGAYDGTAGNGPFKVKARVTISNQKITDIDLIEHRTWKGGAAEGIIPDRIIERQSTRVDAVSGASMSSVAIMNAVEDAVRKAN